MCMGKTVQHGFPVTYFPYRVLAIWVFFLYFTLPKNTITRIRTELWARLRWNLDLVIKRWESEFDNANTFLPNQKVFEVYLTE